jgi:transposase-like protein
MRFVPPRCPNTRCLHHREPVGTFFHRKGYYAPRCRMERVERFVCLGCRRFFSRQTFRHDYRDRRPECNAALFTLLTSGVGMRQCGRDLKLNSRSVQNKQRKLARTLRLLHRSLSCKLPENGSYLLDEEETYEHASIRPLTMPVLIEKDTWFVVATAVGSIRRLAKAGTQRRELQDEAERRHGARRDRSSRCVRAVLTRLAHKAPSGTVTLHTDEKTSYATIARSVLGDRVVHVQTPGKRIRNTHNPLFAINTTMAMTRDNMSRLRRQSWLVSKRGTRLADHLYVFLVYRNYVRRRFNYDKPDETPARLLGLLPRNLLPEEVVAWRQDWRDLSIHPMSPSGRLTVGSSIPA